MTLPILWRGETLVVPRKMVRQIIDHAIAEYPREMCGVLIGPARSYITDWIPITNVSEDPHNFYQMKIEEQIDIWQQTADKNYQICAIVHSHTQRDATFSKTDREYAAFQGMFYVVLSLDPRQLRAYSVDGVRRIDEDYLWEHDVEIDHGKPGLYYCWSHHKYEDTTRAHQVCLECGHTFATAGDLVGAHNQVVMEINERQRGIDRDDLIDVSFAAMPEDVHSCPYCVHGF